MRSIEEKLKKKNFVDSLYATMHDAFDDEEAALKRKISEVVDKYLDIDEHTDLREVTILLSDIRGFTALSERHQAGEIVEMLNTYFAYMNEVILRYDGVIDKYIGDAILVLFGAPHRKEDDPLRAVACAVEMQIGMDRVNQLNREHGLPELFIGIGINTGTVSAGQIGSDLYNEYTVIGDGVNLASRIESHSLRGQVLISEFTYAKVRNSIEVGQLNTVRMKGKSEPVKFYEVTGLNGDRHLTVPRREVRTSVRVEVDSRFTFQIVSGKDVLPESYTGQLKDISYNGFFAVLPDPLEPFTEIRISLSLSLLGGDTRENYAKVMSVRKLPNGYGCGVQFTSIDDESQQAIKDQIDRIIAGG